MNSKLKAISIALATLMATTGVFAAPSSSPQPVTVTNTNSNPVPVSGSVSVSNTVPVSGNVGITGTPSVNIANTPSVTLSGTPTVNVGNSPLPSQLVAIGFTAPDATTCFGGPGNPPLPAPAGSVLIVKNISVAVKDVLTSAGTEEF